MLQVIGKALSTSFKCTRQFKSSILPDQLKTFGSIQLYKYCNDAVTVEDTYRRNDRRNSYQVLERRENTVGDYTRKKEPDFLLIYLRKNRSSDDLSRIIYSIRCYRKVMNSWHIIEVLEQLSDWTMKRKNGYKYILDERDFQYFCQNVDHCIQYMDNQQTLTALNKLYKIGINKTSHPVMSTLLAKITDNMEQYSLDELLFLFILFRRNLDLYRKKEVYLKLSSCLSHGVEKDDISAYNREKLVTFLTILSECNEDGLGTVLKCLFDKDESTAPTSSTVGEVMGILKSYNQLHKSEKLMADVLIKENLTKIASNIDSFTTRQILNLVRHICNATAEGVTVSFCERFMQRACQRMLDAELSSTELMDVFRGLRKMDYFSYELFTRALKQIRKDSSSISAGLIYNIRLLSGSSIALKDDELLQEDLMYIINEAVENLNSQPELLTILTDDSEDIDSDSTDSDSDSVISEAVRKNREVVRKASKLVMTALNLYCIGRKSDVLLKMIVDHYNERQPWYDEFKDNSNDLVFLYKLFDASQKLLDIQLDLPASLMDKGRSCFDLITNKSTEIKELLSDAFSQRNIFRFNVLYDSILMPALIMVDEENNFVDIESRMEETNSESATDDVVSFHTLDTQPGHKKIVILDVPPVGYNSDTDTTSVLDQKLLEKLGFIVISLPKVRSSEREENIKLLKSKFHEIGIEIP